MMEKGEWKYGTPHLTKDSSRVKSFEAYNKRLPECEWLIENCRVMQDALTNCADNDQVVHIGMNTLPGSMSWWTGMKTSTSESQIWRRVQRKDNQKGYQKY